MMADSLAATHAAACSHVHRTRLHVGYATRQWETVFPLPFPRPTNVRLLTHMRVSQNPCQVQWKRKAIEALAMPHKTNSSLGSQPHRTQGLAQNCVIPEALSSKQAVNELHPARTKSQHAPTLASHIVLRLALRQTMTRPQSVKKADVCSSPPQLTTDGYQLTHHRAPHHRRVQAARITYICIASHSRLYAAEFMPPKPGPRSTNPWNLLGRTY